MVKSLDVAVIGLGKLGSPLAAVLAQAGYRVIGVDVDPALVAAMNAGRAPVHEAGLETAIKAAGSRLSATDDIGAAIRATDISFVIVPTPSDSDGVFTNRWVLDAVREIGLALRGIDRYHVVSITSTVMPGSTGGPIREALEKASGRRVGETVGLTYNPEFIALGSVVHDLLHPDMVLIGESDPRAGDLLERLYRGVVGTEKPIQRMNWVNAEIAKISINTFVTTKISYANMLAELCEKLPGADVEVVAAALGKDSRIGSKYLRGALGYGGPCFPRDNVAWAALARSVGAGAEIAAATDAVNRRQVDRLVAIVREHSGPDATIAVLGLAYKAGTPVTEQSQGVMIAQRLIEAGYRVLLSDPLALESAAAVLGEGAVAVGDPGSAVAKARVIVIAAPMPVFAALRPENFTKGGGRKTVIDCWRVLDADVAAVADVVHIGRGPAPEDEFIPLQGLAEPVRLRGPRR
jgi:UDPglucose 6-dehydrogenase